MTDNEWDALEPTEDELREEELLLEDEDFLVLPDEDL